VRVLSRLADSDGTLRRLLLDAVNLTEVWTVYHPARRHVHHPLPGPRPSAPDHGPLP
jgi:hypothetical protein